jgi:hypothetical protein
MDDLCSLAHGGDGQCIPNLKPLIMDVVSHVEREALSYIAETNDGDINLFHFIRHIQGCANKKIEDVASKEINFSNEDKKTLQTSVTVLISGMMSELFANS